MARLKNPATGVVVNVSDDKAARLGDSFVSANAPEPKPAAKKAAPKPAAKSE